MDDSQLKPCPWPQCRKTHATTLWDRIDVNLWAAHVHCQNCGAGGPSMSASTAEAAIEAASTAWNTRTHPSPASSSGVLGVFQQSKPGQ